MKEYKIGRKTFGVLLVVLGIGIIIQLILKINIAKILTIIWPVVLIGLGVEVLIASIKKDINLNYDVAGIMLSFIILFVGSFISIGIYAIDKVSNIDNLKNDIIESRIDKEYIFKVRNRLQLVNNDDSKIKINIIEEGEELEVSTDVNQANKEKGQDDKYIKIVIKANYDYSKTQNIFKAMNSDYDLEKNIIPNLNSNNVLVIEKLPDYITNLNVTITTPSKNYITLKGEFY